jgi:WD40 repeat protein
VLYRAHSCSSASEHEFDSSVALPFHAKPSLVKSLVKSLVCSAANDTFVTCSKDNTIRLWDLNTCDRLHLPHPYGPIGAPRILARCTGGSMPTFVRRHAMLRVQVCGAVAGGVCRHVRGVHGG